MHFARHIKHHNVSHAGLSGVRCAAFVVLICSLLFAQWLGLAHAIGHAGVAIELSAEQPASAANGGFDHQKSATACAALDGVTLGAALHSPPFSPALLAATPLPLAWMAEAGWIAAFRAHFSSRAPPLTA